MSTRFGIGKGMMMPCEVVSAGGGYGLQLMVRKPMPIVPPRGRQCIVEHIVRVVHPVYPVNGLETSFVEPGVVGHQRKAVSKVSKSRL